MSTATVSIHRQAATPPWMRRLLRKRADRVQNVWSTVLVLATMVACIWIATPEFTAGMNEAAIASQAATPHA